MDKLASLGIDAWSMLFYLLNTGVVVVGLFHFLYKPILKFIDDRREQIKKNIEEAQRLQKTFEAKSVENEAKQKEVEAALKEEIEKLQKYTEAKKTQLIAEMDKARTELIQKANKEISDKKDALIKEAEKEILVIMRKIILEIVENKIPENVIQESVDSAWKTYVK